MQVPLQVTFKDMPVDPAVETACRLEAEKLERYYGRITRCRVVVSMPHKGSRRGRHWVVRLDVSIPGKEIVVNRDPVRHRDFEQPGRAVREAFDAARRQLEDHVRRARGLVKTHAEPEQGRVKKLDQRGGSGFSQRPEGPRSPPGASVLSA